MKNYISKSEIGDQKPKQRLINAYNRFIRFLESIYNIYFFTNGTHSKKSYHYLGLAGDGQKGIWKSNRKATVEELIFANERILQLFDKKEKSQFEIAMCGYLAGFNGIGLYPHWKPKQGEHLDLREKHLFWIGLSIDEVRRQLAEIDRKNSQILTDNVDKEVDDRKGQIKQMYIYLK